MVEEGREIANEPVEKNWAQRLSALMVWVSISGFLILLILALIHLIFPEE